MTSYARSPSKDSASAHAETAAVVASSAAPPSSFLRGAVCGGFAATAASACTHPADLFKVRLQLSGELAGRHHRVTIVQAFRQMIAQEGVAGFYRGLSASLLRQMVYAPARFGMFQTLMTHRTCSFLSGGGATNSPIGGSSSLPPAAMLEKLAASLMAGAFGGVISSPCDLVMVRMQADGRLPSHIQRQYGGVFSGLLSVAREGGVASLWRGAAPNIQRAMITTATQFTSYDYFKRACSDVLGLRDGVGMHFAASLMSSVVVATCASPIDVMRTRMMNSRKEVPSQVAAAASAAGATGSPSSASAAYARAYTSTFDCVAHTMRSEGIRGFYKGFLPYFMRVAPQVTLMFVFYEQAQKMADAVGLR